MPNQSCPIEDAPLPNVGPLGVAGHIQMSRRFLAHAEKQLKHHDRVQAAEKIWGAVAQTLKAIGEQRGWQHRGHSNILAINEQLGLEFGRVREFYRYMDMAENMHRNFYENRQSEGAVRAALEDAKLFIAELDEIRAAPPRPYTVRDDDDRVRLGRLLGLPRSARPPIGDYSPVGYTRTPNGAAPGVQQNGQDDGAGGGNDE